jgi:hypothetical protein
MKWLVLGLIVVMIVVAYWIASYGDWHLKRNRNNILPYGKLTLQDDGLYLDDSGIVWELQPDRNNLFHQPDSTPVAAGVPLPYPNMKPPREYKPDYPNLKFLSLDGKGGSYEGILQPDGTYLVKGKKQGTYNYKHPAGFFGYLLHSLFDVIPHLFNSGYDDNLQTEVEN